MASPCEADTSDQRTTAATRPRRTPMRSRNTPARGIASRWAKGNADDAHPYAVFDRPRSLQTVGASAARV